MKAVFSFRLLSAEKLPTFPALSAVAWSSWRRCCWSCHRGKRWGRQGNLLSWRRFGVWWPTFLHCLDLLLTYPQYTSLTKYLYFLRYRSICASISYFFWPLPIWNFWPEEPKNSNFTNFFVSIVLDLNSTKKIPKDPNLILILTMKLVDTYFHRCCLQVLWFRSLDIQISISVALWAPFNSATSSNHPKTLSYVVKEWINLKEKNVW